MAILVQSHRKIRTRNKDGVENGFLIPIFSVHDKVLKPEQYPQQVYLTVISPRGVKGPHLHLKRWGLFTCIRGNARVIVRTQTGYQQFFTGEDHGYVTIQVPAGVPAALQNLGDAEAYMLNMPSPAWREDDQDEHPVTFEEAVFDCTDVATLHPSEEEIV